MTTVCYICFEDHACEANMKRLPCEHSFCRDCIARWRKLNRYCPNCRVPMSKRDFNAQRRRREKNERLMSGLSELIHCYESRPERDEFCDLRLYQLYEKLAEMKRAMIK